jgi:AcrR family transcriptional regulator
MPCQAVFLTKVFLDIPFLNLLNVCSITQGAHNLKHNGQAMKERILKESINLFLHKGYQGTSIKDITDAVNLTKGAIYWYFKSKDELLETILDEWGKSYLSELIKAVDGTKGDFLAKFRHYHKYSTEFARDHRELCMAFNTLAAEMSGSGMPAEKKIKSALRKYTGFMCRLLEQGKKEHALTKDIETTVLANVIMGMHHGILLEWYMKQDEIDGTEMARAFRTVMLSGILNHKSEKKTVTQERGQPRR